MTHPHPGTSAAREAAFAVSAGFLARTRSDPGVRAYVRAMGGSPAGYRRRFAAWLCLAALTASVVALPAMHAAVHLLERLTADHAEPAGPRIVVHRYQHCHGGTCHDDHADRRPVPREGHHHDGDRRGEHGRQSPEHLSLLLAPAAALALPPRITPAVMVVVVAAPRAITLTPLRSHAARAPPAATV